MIKLTLEVLGLPIMIGYQVLSDGEGGKFVTWEILEIKGEPCRLIPVWLYNQIEDTDGEEERIEKICLQHARSKKLC